MQLEQKSAVWPCGGNDHQSQQAGSREQAAFCFQHLGDCMWSVVSYLELPSTRKPLTVKQVTSRHCQGVQGDGTHAISWKGWENLKKRLRSWTNSNSNTLQICPVRKSSTIRKEILKKKRLIQKSVIHIHLDEQLICKKLLPLLLNSELQYQFTFILSFAVITIGILFLLELLTPENWIWNGRCYLHFKVLFAFSSQINTFRFPCHQIIQKHCTINHSFLPIAKS